MLNVTIMLFSVAKIGSLKENILYWIQQPEEDGAVHGKSLISERQHQQLHPHCSLAKQDGGPILRIYVM